MRTLGNSYMTASLTPFYKDNFFRGVWPWCTHTGYGIFLVVTSTIGL